MNDSVVLMIVAVIISSGSQILLKRGAQKNKSGIYQYLNLEVFLGYSFFGLTVLMTIFAYRGLEYKYGPIIESLGYILVTTFSVLFLKEKLNCKKISGCCLILIGIAIYYC